MKLDLFDVSERLESALDKNCQQLTNHGQVMAVYAQGDKRNRLMNLGELGVATPGTAPAAKLLGIESKAVTQLAWLLETLVPVDQARTYGTGGRGRYAATVTLLILSRQADTLGIVLETLSGPYDVQVTNVDANTLRVLREGWLVEAGQDKNYDPALMAWAVRCRINNVQLVKGC